MERLKKEKMTRAELWLASLAVLVYFISYFTRHNFSAAMSEMITDFGTTKAEIGIIGTVSFITYGVGQIICGLIGDRVSPRHFITLGLLGSVACNLLVYFLKAIPAIAVVWGFNGFFQAMIWPPLVRILAENMAPAAFKRACLWVSYACSLSTIAIYLILVPASIRFFSWREAFLIPAFLALATALLWFFGVRKYRSSATPKSPSDTPIVEKKSGGDGIGAALLRAGIPLIFMCVILQGVLRDGIASWMPNFISETYHIENAGAVMTTSVLPIFSVVCVFVTGRVHRRIDNEQKTASIFWTVAVLSAALLMIAYFSSVAVLTIVFMGLLNAAMHGINYLLTSRVSPRFQKYNRVSAVTGAINACTYVGSAVSTYGFALLSDHLGWSATLWSWLIVAALGLLCTLLCVKRYTAFLKE